MNNSTLLLISRLLMAAIFIVLGLGKLGNIEGFAGYMASGGIPSFLAIPVIAFEILGGIALAVGYKTRWVALALGLFCIATGLLYHFPADPAQKNNFFKNLAMAGGYLALYVTGAGKLSIDGRKSE